MCAVRQQWQQQFSPSGPYPTYAAIELDVLSVARVQCLVLSPELTVGTEARCSFVSVMPLSV